MAAKINYGTKLRHSHPVYTPASGGFRRRPACTPRPPSLPLARSSGSATDSATACWTGLASRFNGVNACDSFSKSQSYYDDTATIYAFQCGAGTFRTHTSVVPGVETIRVLHAERCAPTGGANYLMLLIIPPRLGGGGFKRYRDQSVCLSHGAAALGAQLP